MICKLIASSLHIVKECHSFEVLLELVEDEMYKFQSQINNITDETLFKLSLSGDPIKLITENTVSLAQFKNKMFYILLDEYENLENYQQQSINSLIKHNTELYTFKIGVRKTY